jgi:hypothetical protein
MITKIIFLDFDGVLNSQLYYTSGRHGARTISFAHDIDPESVKNLNYIIEKTGAKVVVSSTWRLGRTVEELQSILEQNGFVGEVIGTTKDLRHGEGGGSILRGNEILCWIKEHQDLIGTSSGDYHHYVILDDDSDMLYWQRHNLFLTDGYCGLTPNMAYRIARFLNTLDRTGGND